MIGGEVTWYPLRGEVPGGRGGGGVRGDRQDTDGFHPTPGDASAIPQVEPEVTLSLLRPITRHSLALTETAKATGPVKLHMSVS